MKRIPILFLGLVLLIIVQMVSAQTVTPTPVPLSQIAQDVTTVTQTATDSAQTLGTAALVAVIAAFVFGAIVVFFILAILLLGRPLMGQVSTLFATVSNLTTALGTEREERGLLTKSVASAFQGETGVPSQLQRTADILGNLRQEIETTQKAIQANSNDNTDKINKHTDDRVDEVNQRLDDTNTKVDGLAKDIRESVQRLEAAALRLEQVAKDLNCGPEITPVSDELKKVAARVGALEQFVMPPSPTEAKRATGELKLPPDTPNGTP